jgi:hypothetical protein
VSVGAVDVKDDGDKSLPPTPPLPTVSDTTMPTASLSADDEEAEREASSKQQKIQVPSSLKSAEIEYEHFFNHGTTSGKNNHKFSKTSGSGGGGGANSNEISSNDHLKLENEVIKSKVEVLGQVLKQRVHALRNVPGQRVEL